MYAKITMEQNTTLEDALSNIVVVLTGETDITQMTNISQSRSYISTSRSIAGWELHDNVSNTSVVLKQSYSFESGIPELTRYIKFETGSNYIYWEFYRDWDEINHTGTINRRITSDNKVRTTTITESRVVFYLDAATSWNSFYISSSPWHFASMAGYVGGSNRDESISGISILSERTRFSVHDTVERGLIPIVSTPLPLRGVTWTTNDDIYKNMFNTQNSPTSANYETLSDVNVDSGVKVCSTLSTRDFSGVYNNVNTANTLTSLTLIPNNVLNAQNELSIPIISFGAIQPDNGDLGGNISSLSGIYLTGKIGLQNNIVTDINGTQYRIWASTSAGSVGAQGSQNRFLIIDG